MAPGAVGAVLIEVNASWIHSISDAQKAELDRRLADHAANPANAVPWDEVRESALTRIGR
jgi:putative addiction module component (TIGR02574 family)